MRPLGRGATALAAALALAGGDGCLVLPPTHAAPAEREPHSKLELRTVYEKALGAQLAQRFTVDGLEVARTAARDPSVPEAHVTRAKPGSHVLRVGASFFHTIWRTERRARTESYVCGTTRIGNTTTNQTCTRTVYDDVRVSQHVDDGSCAAAMRVPLEDGAAYRLDFVFRDNQRCSLECKVRVPTPDGAEPLYTACEGASAPPP